MIYIDDIDIYYIDIETDVDNINVNISNTEL